MNESPATCQKVIEFLVDYLEKTLDDEIRIKFETHLDACPYCRDYMSSYEETIRLTRSTGLDATCREINPLPEQLIQAILKSRDGKNGG